MKIRALSNFCGSVSMARGQVLECDDTVVLQDLLSAGYVEEVAEKTPKKRGVKDESK